MIAPVAPTISVSELLVSAPEALRLCMLVPGDLDRRISSPRIQKLGLALAGFSHYIHGGRIQIVGQSEQQYLEQISSDQRLGAIRRLPLEQITAVLVTKSLVPPSEFLTLASAAGLPVLSTHEVSSIAIVKLTEFLQQRLAPCITLHGVMLDLFGIGVLIQGESGIGKSECALDLVVRGHRLVSDDVVEVKLLGSDRLVGFAPEMMQNHIEIRGLGILNVKDLFGVSSVSPLHNLDLIVQLERWDSEKHYDRLGLDEQSLDLLGQKAPLIHLPVTFGRNLATLVEVAARNHLLKRRGVNAAHEFISRHSAAIGSETDRNEG